MTNIKASEVRIGWLVPLLGLLVITDQINFWLTFYVLQDHVPADFLAMLGVLAIIGGFYLISTFVFPAHPEIWPDFDAYYFRVRRIVVGGLLAVNLATLAFALGVVLMGADLARTTGTQNLWANVAAQLFLPILVALLVVKGKRAHLGLLIAANATLLVQAITLAR